MPATGNYCMEISGMHCVSWGNCTRPTNNGASRGWRVWEGRVGEVPAGTLVWQPVEKAEMQWLFQCLYFLPVGKTKPFYFIFMRLQRCWSWKDTGFRSLPGWFLLRPLGHVRQQSRVTLPHLTAAKGQWKSWELSGGCKYHRCHAERRLVVQNESQRVRQILMLDIIGWVQKWKIIRQENNLPLIQRHTSRPI